MKELAHHFHGPVAMATHAVTTSVFWLAFSGVALSWVFYMKRPDIPAAIKQKFEWLYKLLENKYYFDKFNEVVFAGGARLLGKGFWRGGDAGLIDGLIVGGAVRLVSLFSKLARLFQTGHIYHYAFTMIIGVFVLMTLWVTRA
jgi:NADH-quinone oxidoreductase subunit L